MKNKPKMGINISFSSIAIILTILEQGKERWEEKKPYCIRHSAGCFTCIVSFSPPEHFMLASFFRARNWGLGKWLKANKQSGSVYVYI